MQLGYAMLILDLPPSVEQTLIAHAHAQDLSVSQYVQNLLPKADQSNQDPHENLAWEHGKELFGCWESHDGTLSQNVKKLVLQKVLEKHGKNID
ncbi:MULTISPECIES: hypothetical protein [Moraxella]|jgi:hypothetical protein|uniref:Antitoxin n=2 Tax=Moraxella lacunata TaxID=477 RepID=A0A1B8PZ58_MORLA|nr:MULTISPECIES: hypothetical protein [Moraxella]MBE9579195.1 hypothetical protein [Moraxella sp. K1664]MBE9588551.1 hypothetical protein [Moraxella sp. K1630]MBE9589892.1 hypothetical protein [Moraxella sp. K127]MBE9596665.1 hypothetical protein [Moraxella sp. K2450]MDH9219338.1 hypothetical protein [Moraxella lacunata]